jgi:hypothetical protein
VVRCGPRHDHRVDAARERCRLIHVHHPGRSDEALAPAECASRFSAVGLDRRRPRRGLALAMPAASCALSLDAAVAAVRQLRRPADQCCRG